MKRALLIVGGTVGGLGAVMAITPPHLSSTSGLAMGGSVASVASLAPATQSAPTTQQSAATTPSQSPTQVTSTQRATKKSVVKKAVAKHAATTKSAAALATATGTATGTATANPAAAEVATPTATTVQTAAVKAVTGSFVGPAVFVNYGTVQVKLTVRDGKIIDATALQAPTGRNARWTDMALPILKKQTLAAQSDAIQGASGASYTSYGWLKSLQGALAKAGL